MECPYKRAIIIEIIKNIDTDEIVNIKRNADFHELIIRELTKMFDYQMTAYLNAHRKPGTSPIESIFQKQDNTPAPRLVQFRKE